MGSRLPDLDRDGRLVLAAKAVRAFAFGLNSVVLGLYLAELGLSPLVAGAVFAAALLGTMLLTLVIALRGDHIGRRRLLVAGSLLMALAVFIPVVGATPALLVLIGLTGMVAVTSNESTGLHSVDQAILPQTVPIEGRTDAFALYSLVAFAATAVGAIVVGPLVAVGERLGLVGPDRYGPAFVAYAVAGVVAAALATRLDAAAEVGGSIEPGFAIRRSRGVVARLSSLFALDSFAGGLVVQSFLAYYLSTRFGFDPGQVGALFFAGSLLGAASFPVAARLARRIGLIRTMVFTHIPSSLLLIALAAVPPDAIGLAALLYLARALLSSMDVPTRQSYVMAVVDPSERTATAGVTSLARSAAQTAGPLVAGAVLVPIGLGAPLVVCGLLKITYDVLLYTAFRARPAPGEVLPAPAEA
ncbi:MAG: MFS transporter [Chloroflexota bacterium]